MRVSVCMSVRVCQCLYVSLLHRFVRFQIPCTSHGTRYQESRLTASRIIVIELLFKSSKMQHHKVVHRAGSSPKNICTEGLIGEDGEGEGARRRDEENILGK